MSYENPAVQGPRFTTEAGNKPVQNAPNNVLA